MLSTFYQKVSTVSEDAITIAARDGRCTGCTAQSEGHERATLLPGVKVIQSESTGEVWNPQGTYMKYPPKNLDRNANGLSTAVDLSVKLGKDLVHVPVSGWRPPLSLYQDKTRHRLRSKQCGNVLCLAYQTTLVCCEVNYARHCEFRAAVQR